jgi:GDP-4-dehydro-6-deoxy-D-mannose reductase
MRTASRTPGCFGSSELIGGEDRTRADSVPRMRVLITGAGGFAGSHLAELCRERGADVTGVGRGEAPPGDLVDAWIAADVTDAGATARAAREARPERVFHLAAQAHVGVSWRDARGTIDANVAGTLGVLDAVAAEAPDARVLVVGSGEQYGPVPAERLPVGEDQPFRPQNPYAVSKCASDLAAGFYADAHGLDVVRTRSFNHAGPRQHERYVVASFARQIALAEAEGKSSVTVHTGDTRPRRDFTDVRDVAQAYWLALERAPAGVYNVCSGRVLSVADILAALAGLTDLKVEQATDPALLRDREVMEIRGSHDRLTGATGWQPAAPIERTLADTLEWWRVGLSEGVAR